MQVKDKNGRWINSSDNRQSRFFDEDRVFDLDSMENWQEMGLQPLWIGGERQYSPMVYRVRKVLEYLRPDHREVLERHYFEGESLASIARDRKVTEAAVRGMVKRAKDNFVRAWAEHALEFPYEEE